MAKEIDKQIILDNRFFVPPGVIDVRSAGEQDGSGFYDAVADVADIPDASAPDPDSPSILLPPTSFTIVEQRVRISTDGKAAVDVLLEFPDVPGVQTIDLRVTKV